MATSRQRDYQLEEERRNIRARALGFENRYQMRKARERGYIPPARDKTPEAKRLLEEYLADRAERPTKRTRGLSLAEIDRRNQSWYDAHARQRVTRYSSRFGERRKRMYYDAFVASWLVPNDERDFRATYNYMVAFGEYDKGSFVDNPYRN